MKKLLIIGHGGHGIVTAETAEATGLYETIDFADDNDPNAVGKIEDLEYLHKQYDCAFVGIGDNLLRAKLIHKLETIGYEIPVLIHPTAYVSKSATIEKGTVLEPKSIVNANTYSIFVSIISVGAIIDHNAKIGSCCHVNAGAIVKAGGEVENFKKLEAGEVVLGYEAARVSSTAVPDGNSVFKSNSASRTE